MNGKNVNVEKLNKLFFVIVVLVFANTLFLSSLLQFGLTEIPVRQGSSGY